MNNIKISEHTPGASQFGLQEALPSKWSEDKSVKPPVGAVHAWRIGIFEAIADRLCDRNMNIIQRAIGMWPWHTGINVPKRKDVAMLPDGAMRISVFLGSEKYQLDINIWMFLSEVRVGVRVPNAILRKATSLSHTISTSYDGTMCQRVTEGVDDVFFDWIFRDGFAAKDLMANSIENPAVAAMIADALSNVVTHLYMAAMNAILNTGFMIVGYSGGVEEASGAMQLILKAWGFEDQEDLSELGKALSGLGIHIDSVFPQSEESILYLISYDAKNDGSIRVAIENLVATMGGQHEFMEVEQIEQ